MKKRLRPGDMCSIDPIDADKLYLYDLADDTVIPNNARVMRSGDPALVIGTLKGKNKEGPTIPWCMLLFQGGLGWLPSGWLKRWA
jgi:hypothetical protein